MCSIDRCYIFLVLGVGSNSFPPWNTRTVMWIRHQSAKIQRTVKKCKPKRNSVHWDPSRAIWLFNGHWVGVFQCYPYVTHPVAPHPSHALFLHPTNPRVHLPITPRPPPPLPLHLLLWTAGSQCVILFIPRFSSPLSPLHPSIPFFHVCSAVKPSWIRPASLVTCSLCWCGNERAKTIAAETPVPAPLKGPFVNCYF